MRKSLETKDLQVHPSASGHFCSILARVTPSSGIQPHCWVTPAPQPWEWGEICRPILISLGLQLLFLTGLSLIIGLRRTFSFFFQRHKLKGTSFFLGGVAIVLLRWPLLGMLLEAYGFVSLFK